jgi:hypothetical protein
MLPSSKAHFVVAERLVKADPALDVEPKLDWRSILPYLISGWAHAAAPSLLVCPGSAGRAKYRCFTQNKRICLLTSGGQAMRSEFLAVTAGTSSQAHVNGTHAYSSKARGSKSSRNVQQQRCVCVGSASENM